MSSIISSESYWLDGLGSPPGISRDLPSSCDVVIIGSGYTGLNAAIETARGGCSTLVLESGTAGFGCSTRNGGQVSTSIKPSLDVLTKRYGAERARGIRAEGRNALEWIEQRIAQESIDCDFIRCGRFHGAHTPKHFEKLVRDSERLYKDEGIPFHVIPESDQTSELNSEAYFGGVVYERHCSLHPAKYHRGLLSTAISSGATIVDNCMATRIDRVSSGFTVTTERGVVNASSVIIATNGYTSRSDLTHWHRRRIVPIVSSIIATDELPTSLIDDLFPSQRTVTDTRKIVYYYRASPDRRRVLFGGRVSSSESTTTLSASRLHDELSTIFPQLSDCGISHSWGGTVGFTFDELAHTGEDNGIYYSMGYCGSGVSMASYLGMRLGQKVLGLSSGISYFDNLPFPTRPFYTGTAWFLPLIIGMYRLRDRWEHSRALGLYK